MASAPDSAPRGCRRGVRRVGTVCCVLGFESSMDFWLEERESLGLSPIRLCGYIWVMIYRGISDFGSLNDRDLAAIQQCRARGSLSGWS